MVRTTAKAKGKKHKPLAASKDKTRDLIPRTGLGVGSAFVDSASKFLAGYGKILAPVVVIGLAAAFLLYFWEYSTDQDRQVLLSKIDVAAGDVDELKDLAEAMEDVIAEAEADFGESEQAYAYYRQAVRGFKLLEPPFKVDELAVVVGFMEDYSERASELEAEAGHFARIKALQDKLEADLDFLKKDKGRLPWTHQTEFEKPETKIVDDETNPIVAFVTSVGTVRFELYEDDAKNAVRHFVSICDEGFFDRTEFDAVEFSNRFNPTGAYRGSTVIKAGDRGRPIGVELKKSDLDEDDPDADTLAVNNPYTIDYQGSLVRGFDVGTIALIRDRDDPSRARTEFVLVVDMTEAASALGRMFSPLGHLLGGKEGLETARRLDGAEIYYTYVVQKRSGDYLPKVYYDGWPVAVPKRTKVPDPIRFSKLELEIIPESAEKQLNPLIVIELEKGDILIELFEDTVPNTVKNFISLIEEGFYGKQDCNFYRVEGNATDIVEIYRNEAARIIQGGAGGSSTHDYVIKNEAVDNDRYFWKNRRGFLAMARTGELHSAATEFFINLRDYKQWDDKKKPYCVFGRVLEGLDLAARVAENDEIISIKVLRKREATTYLPKVKYKNTTEWVEKKKVDPDEDGDTAED